MCYMIFEAVQARIKFSWEEREKKVNSFVTFKGYYWSIGTAMKGLENLLESFLTLRPLLSNWADCLPIIFPLNCLRKQISHFSVPISWQL